MTSFADQLPAELDAMKLGSPAHPFHWREVTEGINGPPSVSKLIADVRSETMPACRARTMHSLFPDSLNPSSLGQTKVITMKPSLSILEKSFRYVPAAATSVSETWSRFGWVPPRQHSRALMSTDAKSSSLACVDARLVSRDFAAPPTRS